MQGPRNHWLGQPASWTRRVCKAEPLRSSPAAFSSSLFRCALFCKLISARKWSQMTRRRSLRHIPLHLSRQLNGKLCINDTTALHARASGAAAAEPVGVRAGYLCQRRHPQRAGHGTDSPGAYRLFPHAHLSGEGMCTQPMTSSGRLNWILRGCSTVATSNLVTHNALFTCSCCTLDLCYAWTRSCSSSPSSRCASLLR